MHKWLITQDTEVIDRTLFRFLSRLAREGYTFKREKNDVGDIWYAIFFQGKGIGKLGLGPEPRWVDELLDRALYKRIEDGLELRLVTLPKEAGRLHRLYQERLVTEETERQADSDAVGEEATAAENEEGKVEIFYAYAHEDEDLRDELEKHLRMLEREGVIKSWHDRKIGAGKEWKGEIDTHLNAAHVILLLVSSDFIDSDYCWDVEVKRAMERHEAGEARSILVILRPVDWMSAPFGKLQALPTDAKPVTSWENQDEAFLDIAQGIRAAVRELRAEGNDSDPDHEEHNQ